MLQIPASRVFEAKPGVETGVNKSDELVLSSSSSSSLVLSSSANLSHSSSSSNNNDDDDFSTKTSAINTNAKYPIDDYEKRFLNSLKQLNAPEWLVLNPKNITINEKVITETSSTKPKYDRIRQKTKEQSWVTK